MEAHAARANLEAMNQTTPAGAAAPALPAALRLGAVHLTVTDSAGLAATTFRDVRPRTSTVSVDASTPGLTVNLDGQPMTTPFSFESVVGLKRTLEAPATQGVGGTTYTFRSWGTRRGTWTR